MKNETNLAKKTHCVLLGSQQGLEICGLNELSVRRLACSFFLSFTGNFTWFPFTLIFTFILSLFVSCLMNFYQLIRFLVGDLYYIRLSKVQEINNSRKVLKGFFQKTSAWQQFELSALQKTTIVAKLCNKKSCTHFAMMKFYQLIRFSVGDLLLYKTIKSPRN